MITFTAQQRLDITRRQLNIVAENAGYASTSASLNTQQTQLLNVDSANAVFYLAQTAQVAAYEGEARAINGVIPATYTDGTISPFAAGDLSSSAQTPGAAAAVFFPNSPPYAFFVPKQIDAVNGILHPTGTDAQYELNILTNTVIPSGLTQSLNVLLNGISGASGNTTTTIALPGGALTGFSLTVTSSTNFSVNDYIYINQGSNSGVYQITATAMGSLTINSIFPSTVGCSTGAMVNNTVPGFTNSERQSLSSANYQEILTNVTNAISGLITAWQSKVTSQNTFLATQQETRSPQQAQNTSAVTANTSTLSVLNTWIALSNTGVNGKYADSSLAPIQSQITTRQSYATTRVTQITTALGSVTVTENTFTGVTGSPYYERYKWLNNRINTASGSARRYFAANQGISFLGTLSANNTMIGMDYSQYFLTKAIKFLDATPIIQVPDLTGLSNGDMLTVVSEKQPEIKRAIVALMGTNQIQLDQPIPNTYQIVDQARIFKTL